MFLYNYTAAIGLKNYIQVERNCENNFLNAIGILDVSLQNKGKNIWKKSWGKIKI